MDLKHVGNFIATLRKEKGLTQEKLGEQLGVSSKTVSKWERGVNAPDIFLLESLSNILDVDIKEILNGERISKNSLSKKHRRTIIKIITAIFLVILLSFPVLFTIFNYNTVQIYNIKSKTDKFLLQVLLCIIKKEMFC